MLYSTILTETVGKMVWKPLYPARQWENFLPKSMLQQKSRALNSQSKQDLEETEDSDRELAKINHRGAHTGLP